MASYSDNLQAQKVYLQKLRTALENAKPPFYSGTTNVRKRDLLLFYDNRKGGAGSIDMSDASETELKKLADACVPATFGHNDESVLDLSYRKAGKLDSENFSTKLDLESVGLMNTIRYGLIEGEQSIREFSAELYKLNVYDKGAFFKAHKDTPRSTNMFGSLVVVYPAAHEGGALILRHGGKEWTLDSGRALADAPNDSDSAQIVYAMFFSDVEHEVNPVTSGYRVTLTYNLYFNDNAEEVPGPSLSDAAVKSAQVYPPEAAFFKSALVDLLADPSFMPEGGSLGFGLFHKYPIIKSSRSVGDLNKYLKGRDAMVMNVCTELSLDANAWFLYNDGDDSSRTSVITRSIVEPKYTIYDDAFVTFLLNAEYRYLQPEASPLHSREVADIVARPPWYYGERPQCHIIWVNDIVSDLNGVTSAYAAHGNEPSVEFAYANVCLVVEIGRPGARKTVSNKYSLRLPMKYQLD